MVPKGTHDVGEQLKVAQDALVKGGQTKVRACCSSYIHVLIVLQLFTPMYLMVGKKPKSS